MLGVGVGAITADTVVNFTLSNIYFNVVRYEFGNSDYYDALNRALCRPLRRPTAVGVGVGLARTSSNAIGRSEARQRRSRAGRGAASCTGRGPD